MSLCWLPLQGENKPREPLNNPANRRVSGGGSSLQGSVLPDLESVGAHLMFLLLGCTQLSMSTKAGAGPANPW